MRKSLMISTAAVVGVALSACTSTATTAPESRTPANVIATAEYNPKNFGGAIEWTITGGSGAIPDQASVLVSIAQDGATLRSPGPESSSRTESFAEQVGEVDAGVIASPDASSGQLNFVFEQEEPLGNLQVPRVHLALIDDETGEPIVVRSVSVELIDIAGPQR